MVVTSKDDTNAEKKHGRSLKIVIRRLPPTITEHELLEQMSPMPPNQYFKFVPADYSLSPWAYSRAYVNLTNSDDVILFRDRFNGYVFVDTKGNEFPAMVEFAPSQKIPAKKQKKDPKCNTIEDDAEYKEFLEELKNPKHAELPTLDSTLAEIERKEKEFKEGHGVLKVKTPLIEFIEWRKEEKYRRQQEKRRQREEERKRREEERKKRIEQEALRKQREKEKKEKEAAKKAASKPERAPRFEKNRESGSKYDEDWDNSKSYQETDYYDKNQKSSGKPSSYRDESSRSGSSKNRNYKYDDSSNYDYAPPRRGGGGGGGTTAASSKKPSKKDQNEYYDSPGSSMKKQQVDKKATERAGGGNEETKPYKGRAEPRWKRDAADYPDEAPDNTKAVVRKPANKDEDFKQPYEPTAAAASDSAKGKTKSRYKDKPSQQLYQPGKNRKLVESQEKPLVFKDPEDIE